MDDGLIFFAMHFFLNAHSLIPISLPASLNLNKVRALDRVHTD